MNWNAILSGAADNPLAVLVAALLTIAGGWRMWRQQTASDTVRNADQSGQIAALEVWRQLLESERAARVTAETRADQFAKERNEALQQVWELSGQLKGMATQLEAVQDELAQLKEKIHATR